MQIVTKDQFLSEFTKGKVIVDFYAEWCGPCKAITPSLESLEKEYPSVKLVKINIDDVENMDLVTGFGVRSVPTLVALNDNQAVFQLVGGQPKENLRKLFDALQ